MANDELKFTATLKDELTPSANKIGDSIKGIASKAGIAAVAAVGMSKAFDLAKASIDEFKSAELTVARLSATVKAAGDRTAYTSVQLQKMATQMQGKSIFGDEAYMDAQRVMLTMQNISDDVIPKAIQAAADMSTSEEELASKSFALGKALESPAEGFTALKRSGIILGDQAEKMVKQLMEEGRLREAQGLLLAEVEKRYGGVSKAMAETSAGMDMLAQNKLGDALEELGRRTLPLQTAMTNLQLLAVNTFNAWDELWNKAAEGMYRKAMEANGYFTEYEGMSLKALLAQAKQLREHRGKNEKEVEESGARLVQIQAQIDSEQLSLAKAFNAKQAEAEKVKAAEAKNIKDAKKAKEKASAEEAKKTADATYAEAKKRYDDQQIYLLKIKKEQDDSVDARTNRRNAADQKAQEDAASARLQLEEETARESARIAEQEARVKEDIERAKRNSIVSTGKTMADGLISAIKLAKEGNKKTKEDALKMAILQGAIAHAGAAASIWSTMGGSWQEKLAESIAVSAALFTSQAVEIASINKQNFATGGIVQGPSSGDNVQVNANGGEMFLTKSMQQNLLTMARGGSGGGGASITISPVVKVDSGMTAGERDRMIRATAESVRTAMIHLVQTNRVPAGLVYR